MLVVTWPLIFAYVSMLVHEECTDIVNERLDFDALSTCRSTGTQLTFQMTCDGYEVTHKCKHIAVRKYKHKLEAFEEIMIDMCNKIARALNADAFQCQGIFWAVYTIACEADSHRWTAECTDTDIDLDEF